MTTSLQDTSRSASECSMTRGVRPPLTAKLNVPCSPMQRFAVSATKSAAALDNSSALANERSSWCTSGRLLDVTTELGAHGREHLGGELSSSARFVALPQRGADHGDGNRLLDGRFDRPATLPGVRDATAVVLEFW